MENKSVARYIVYAFIGFAIFAAGAVMVKSGLNTQGIMKSLPFILIGIGAGVFGQNLGTAVNNYTMNKNPVLAKQKDIEVNDERNTFIRYKAKAKAYDLMIMVFGALMMAFALMQADFVIVLAFVTAYLFVAFSNVYYVNKYHKEL